MFKGNLSRCAVQSGNMFKGKLLNVLETPQEQGSQKNPSKNPPEHPPDNPPDDKEDGPCDDAV